MKKASSKSKEHLCSHKRPAKVKEFLVDPSRLELDEYMLNKIKKNNKSVRTLNKEVITLRKQVRRLNSRHDDYMLLQKTKTQDHSHYSHLPESRSNQKSRIALTQKLIKNKSRSRNMKNSKEHSILSISSSGNSSRRSIKSMKNNTTTDVHISKTRLNLKIEELKAKAGLEEQEKEKIKREVRNKIKRTCESAYINTRETPTKEERELPEAVDQNYQQLLELLRTTKSFKCPSPGQSQPTESPKATELNKLSQCKKEPQNVRFSEQSEKTIEVDAFRSNSKIYNRSSLFGEENKPPSAISNPYSQTNLLDSPGKSLKEVPQPSRKKLQMSRCIDVRIESQKRLSLQESGFDGLFDHPVEVRSGVVEMSFEGEDSSKKRLRQLEFQFDQLVRQQLMVSDPLEKEMLGQTIHSVLWSINELKGKLNKES